MRLVRAFGLACAVASVPYFSVRTALAAEPSDRGAAYAQLKQGYALKVAGKCEEATRHFLESVRLDRQPKALINLADCERDLGRYVSAEVHFVEARDLARELGSQQFVTLAEERLRALDLEMPRLTVALASDAPADTEVSRDGVLLGAVSLGIPLPIDAGKHTVLARGGGFERTYELELAKADKQVLEITPIGGTRIAINAVTSEPPPSSSKAAHVRALADVHTNNAKELNAPKPAPKGDANVSSSSFGAQRTVGVVIASVGLVGLTVGVGFGFRARSKADDAAELCTHSDPCEGSTRPYRATRNEALTARTISIAGFAGGGALLAAGGFLVLTGGERAETARLRLAPDVASNHVGAVAGGVW